jgi:membrane associated rhomboid family serine protease
MDKNLRVYTKRRLGNNNSFSNLSRKFDVTTWIIIINIIVFVVVSILAKIYDSDKVFFYVALQANNFFSGVFWTLLTNMFMHVNLTHLFVNMVSLFFIGSFIEKLIGRKRFFWFYILSGIFAGIFFVFLAYFFGGSELGAKIFGSPSIYAVGASGAIFALGGLLAVLIPKLRVYVFFVIPMDMWLAMAVLLGGFWLASIFGGLPIGNSAHLGGLLAGLGYAFYLRKKYKRKVFMIRKYFS